MRDILGVNTVKNVILGLFLAAGVANAGVYNLNFDISPDVAIPDGTPTGWSDSRSVTTESGLISQVTVGFNVSGGYNGDLYAYLSYSASGGGSGFSVLLNRVGKTSGNEFGSDSSGFASFLLDDINGIGDIHTGSYTAGSPISGTYLTDARNIDPASTGVQFDAASRTAGLSSFNGLNANGTWTLFFADMASGDTSTVQSWSLNLTVIPEPINVALGVIAGIFVAVAVGRKLLSKTAA